MAIGGSSEHDDVGVVVFLVAAQAIERPLDAFAIVAAARFQEEIAALELVDRFHDIFPDMSG